MLRAESGSGRRVFNTLRRAKAPEPAPIPHHYAESKSLSHKVAEMRWAAANDGRPMVALRRQETPIAGGGSARLRRQRRGDGRHSLNNRAATTLVRAIRAWSEAP